MLQYLVLQGQQELQSYCLYQQLVLLLLKSSKWSQIHCVVRRELDQWKQLPQRNKLVIERHNDMDEYFKINNQNKYKHINAVFCMLGSQVKHGEETFRKIDKTYPLLAADIALQNKIPNYLLFSSRGGDTSSMFLYLRVKGQVQQQLKQKKLNMLSIFKPGLLTNRRDARTGQKIFGICPCVPKIEARGAAEALMIIAERNANKAYNEINKVQIFENNDMVEITQKQKNN